MTAPPPRHWMPILVLALGVGSILLLLANNRIQQSLIAPDLGSLRAVGEIQTRLAVAHLWIEEYVAGDDVDLEEIERSLERAARLAESVERRSSEGAQDAAPTDEAIRSLTARVAAGVERFNRLTRERRAAADAGADVGIGSPVDVVYDRAFAGLDKALGDLERALLVRLTGTERRAALLFRGLLVAWSLIVVLAAVALWTRERRQRETETALGDSQARLLQAQKMEAVGRLAGGLAHDINNYLAAIAAQAELIKMKAEPESAAARRADAILATTGRAGALIERLLAFSRRQPARPEPVDINRTLESLDGMLRRLLGADVRLESRLAPGLWPIEIDVSQLEQVVLNLAVNAREAMTRGGTLTLATRNVSASSRPGDGKPHEDRVALAVADSGPGIPKELERKIFEPFFTTKESSHSGLGLATVLGVVEQNDGRIEVESTHEGTRFEILFPRSDREVAPVPPEDVPPALSSVTGKRILLVEDNGEVRRSTKDLLTSWGYSVDSAADGLEALTLFEQGPRFDLLVTDVVMPGLSGRELAERIRAIAPALPVLYVSGNADDVVLRHGLAAGDIDLLSKPFTARQLAKRVRSALDRSGGTPSGS